jgi:ABC-type polysaccharide/polyol phosphate export permease
MSKKVVEHSATYAALHTGEKIMSKLAKHPVLVFGLGVAAGYLVYKYRKNIISSAAKVVDSSKDFVLQQKENLEDIVAETKEENP